MRGIVFLAAAVTLSGCSSPKPADPADEAKTALSRRLGSEIELHYIVERQTGDGTVVCGYAAGKPPEHSGAAPPLPLNDKAFIFKSGRLDLQPDTDDGGAFRHQISTECPSFAWPPPAPPVQP